MKERYTVRHLELDELAILKSDASLLIKLLHNIHIFRIQKLLAGIWKQWKKIMKFRSNYKQKNMIKTNKYTEKKKKKGNAN